MPVTQALNTLRYAYDRQRPEDELNTALRKALRQHAAAEKLRFCDNIGNIYISRLGRDTELADIAITFPLDTCGSSAIFGAAFKLFSHLAHDDLICGVTLMGYTSRHGNDIGRQFWQTPGGEVATMGQNRSLLEEFIEFPSPTAFSFSALFEIIETQGGALALHGSTLLVEKASTFVRNADDLHVTVRNSSRAPSLIIKGPSAEILARETIHSYSEYIVALFDNFD